MRRAALLLLGAVPGARSHAAMTSPMPRNGGSLAERPSSQKSIKWYTVGVSIPGKPVITDDLVTERRFGAKGHPWKAPGTAPVWSPCGSYCDDCKKPGTDGRTLPPQEKVTWQAGSAVEVAWGINTNHGGGYSYRLCPASSELTEECFQRHPLNFVGDTTWAQFGDNTSSRQAIPAVRTSLGVNGSMWSKNPIPNCQGKDWACPFPAPISGHWWGNDDGKIMGQVNLIDLVRVPSLPPGDYVLGWRWDCDSTAQVWQNCADVTIIKSSSPTPAPAPPVPGPPAPAPVPGPTPGAVCKFTDGYDCDGNNIKSHIGVDTPGACCDLCVQTSGCTAFTHAQKGKKQPTCYLKRACPSKTQKSSCTAGVISNL